MRRGVLLLFACAALWSLSGAMIKQLQSYGLTGLSIAIWRSLFAGLALLIPSWIRLRTLPRTGWMLTAIASFAAMCALFVSATTQTQASNAIILQYTAPCWIFVLSPLLLREHPPQHDWFVLALATCGVVVIFYFQYTVASLGLILALASGVAFALVVLSFRRLRGADGMALTCVVNLATVCILALVPLCAGIVPSAAVELVRAPVPGVPAAWLLLIAMGAFQMALPYWLLTLSLRTVSAATASLITLAEPLLNTAWTFLFSGERPRPSTLAGGGVILAALVVKNLLDRRALPRPELRS